MAHQKQQSQYVNAEVLKAQQSERQFLARELHDEMGQYLTAMHYYASSIIQLSNIDSVVQDAMAIDRIRKELMSIVHHKISTLRSIPSVRMNLESIHNMIDEWEKNHPDIHLSVMVNFPKHEEYDDVLQTVFRLIQESLTNISRHADANHVWIQLQLIKTQLVLMIKDDGKGFDVTKSSKRHGLIGMKERVSECQGAFLLHSAIAKGVEIRILLPLKGQVK